MKSICFRVFLIFILSGVVAGCANIVPPSGGKKDTTPPKLASISPADSQLERRVTKIEMRFNEFINVNNASTEVQVSPLLKLPISVTNVGRRVYVEIPDTLLNDNTTYRLTFGNAISDLHEGNVFTNYAYTFSTGSYFDSLNLDGIVLNAAAGLPDSGGVVMLYEAATSDSVVVREKPVYVAPVQAGGHFSIKGLPQRAFRIYALNDGNGNLVYDGGEETIAFLDSLVTPIDSVSPSIVLKRFKEKLVDTLGMDSTVSMASGKLAARSRGAEREGFFYSVAVDTSDARKRTFDITKPLYITFNKLVDSIVKGRVNLTFDSADIAVESDFTLGFDTVREERLWLNTHWKENTVYTLRLLKGFAKDSAMTDAMPSRYTFRTKSDEDYARLHIHLPSKYRSSKYVLMVNNETDTVYQKPVVDTMVHLSRLQPGSYKMRIIVDENGNGFWDTGDLFEEIQPEEVIPYHEALQLRPGWDNTIDFEPAPPAKRAGARGTNSGKSSPPKRDKP
ncbi:Ig-like domain-containing protein [Polluticoccus soli]|uniref:Ig-like domain-containing protein n=1 Tax=Polluticoccus soli TaxID=3034150 RepID=UPI0023E1157E|nr:Ig-like domain-containing protein [Flavipsychrobacter sp. JY13-12]